MRLKRRLGLMDIFGRTHAQRINERKRLGSICHIDCHIESDLA